MTGSLKPLFEAVPISTRPGRQKRRGPSRRRRVLLAAAWTCACAGVLASLSVALPWLREDRVRLAGWRAALLHDTGLRRLRPTHPALCRWIPPPALLEQVAQHYHHGGAPEEEQAGTSSAGGVEGSRRRLCREAEDACRADSMCHVNQWEATLAKPVCQRQQQRGCSHRAPSKVERINPEYCNVCREARANDEARCLETRRACEDALRRCSSAAAEGARGAGRSFGSVRFLSFWDENSYDPDEFLGWANFGFTDNVGAICRGAAAGIQHMLKVHGTFFQRADEADSKGRRRLELAPGWRRRWEEQRGVVTDLLAGGAIFGICLGDELVWNGLQPAELEEVAAAIRADVPHAVLWLNEARPPVKSGLTQFVRRLSAGFEFPRSVDWVSVDSYHFGPDPEHVPETRRFYNRYVYPKLLPNQSAVLVPGSFASDRNQGCDRGCYDEFMATDADAFMQWSCMDRKVAAVVPYHWNSCWHCLRTRNEVGTRDMNVTKAAWKAFGQAMQMDQAKVLAAQCSRHYDPALRANLTLFRCLRKVLIPEAYARRDTPGHAGIG